MPGWSWVLISFTWSRNLLTDHLLYQFLFYAVFFTLIASLFQVSLMSFMVYVLEDSRNVLTPDKAFVSLSLFNILRLPLTMLPLVLTMAIQVIIFSNGFLFTLKYCCKILYVKQNLCKLCAACSAIQTYLLWYIGCLVSECTVWLGTKWGGNSWVQILE